jgi:membrane protein YqaA with SNARE-associated domain
METFVLLNIIALGTLAGTITGLAIGYAAKRQKPAWSEMTAEDKRVNLALILFFTLVYIALLTWYVLQPPVPAIP